jgi:hypothetical protein
LEAIQGLLLGLLKGCAHCIAECVVYNDYGVILLRELIPHLKGSLFCIKSSSPGWRSGGRGSFFLDSLVRSYRVVSRVTNYVGVI